jgi:hypothetical protein
MVLLPRFQLNFVAYSLDLPPLPLSPPDQIANEKPFEGWNQRHRENEKNTGQSPRISERRITLPLTSHFSAFTSPQPPLTNHFSPLTAAPSGPTVRLQDLFLILSQCVDLGLLSITAAFRSARDLKKILGSGFEIVRISQCESPRFFLPSPNGTEKL